MAKDIKLSKSALSAIVYIIVGILFCVFKTQVLSWLMTAVGVILIVYGLYALISLKRTTEAVLYMAVGAIILLGGWLFVEIALIILGVAVLIQGIVDLSTALKSKSTPAILSAILTIVVGILLVLGKFLMLDWFFIVLGVIFIVDGVMTLFGMKK